MTDLLKDLEAVALQGKQKKTKKRNHFNDIPINPPKGWKEKEVLPGQLFRVIPR